MRCHELHPKGKVGRRGRLRERHSISPPGDRRHVPRVGNRRADRLPIEIRSILPLFAPPRDVMLGTVLMDVGFLGSREAILASSFRYSVSRSGPSEYGRPGRRYPNNWTRTVGNDHPTFRAVTASFRPFAGRPILRSPPRRVGPRRPDTRSAWACPSRFSWDPPSASWGTKPRPRPPTPGLAPGRATADRTARSESPIRTPSRPRRSSRAGTSLHPCHPNPVPSTLPAEEVAAPAKPDVNPRQGAPHLSQGRLPARLSHHDLMRTFERMLHRSAPALPPIAGLPPPPAPRLRPVAPARRHRPGRGRRAGTRRASALDEIRDRLTRQAPAGLEILAIDRIAPNETAQVVGFRYGLVVPADRIAATRRRLDADLLAAECWVERTGRARAASTSAPSSAASTSTTPRAGSRWTCG